jgi:glycogen operon protein
VLDIDWLDERGQRLSPEDWSNVEGRALVMALAAAEEDKTELAAVLMNASDRPLDFHLPDERQWRVLLDSSDPQKPERNLSGNSYTLPDRAAAIVITNIAGGKKEQAP